jgi:hypothetical protein
MPVRSSRRLENQQQTKRRINSRSLTPVRQNQAAGFGMTLQFIPLVPNVIPLAPDG